MIICWSHLICVRFCCRSVVYKFIAICFPSQLSNNYTLLYTYFMQLSFALTINKTKMIKVGKLSKTINSIIVHKIKIWINYQKSFKMCSLPKLLKLTWNIILYYTRSNRGHMSWFKLLLITMSIVQMCSLYLKGLHFRFGK